MNSNAPSAIEKGALGTGYMPDYFVFDRYENDDSAAPGDATLYNARSWDNYLTAVGQVSTHFNNIPIMMWQIPGSHIPYVGESNPEELTGQGIPPNLYIFSTAPDYFFGDANLKPDLSNMIMGPTNTTYPPNSEVGNFKMDCSSNRPITAPPVRTTSSICFNISASRTISIGASPKGSSSKQ